MVLEAEDPVDMPVQRVLSATGVPEQNRAWPRTETNHTSQRGSAITDSQSNFI